MNQSVASGRLRMRLAQVAWLGKRRRADSCRRRGCDARILSVRLPGRFGCRRRSVASPIGCQSVRLRGPLGCQSDLLPGPAGREDCCCGGCGGAGWPKERRSQIGERSRRLGLVTGQGPTGKYCIVFRANFGRLAVQFSGHTMNSCHLSSIRRPRGWSGIGTVLQPITYGLSSGEVLLRIYPYILWIITDRPLRWTRAQ